MVRPCQWPNGPKYLRGPLDRADQWSYIPSMENEMTKVTFRKTGKCHRGLVRDGWLVAACSCPGSQNGKLTNGAQIICEGWDKATCGH